jgi:uncharacterized glyoxalase superfamily protein PhnB
MQRAVPMLSYEDCAAAADWLIATFGFQQVGERLTDTAGRVTHVELDLDGAGVMVGWPGPAYEGPRHHASGCAEAAAWLAVPFVVDGTLVYVRDVDAKHASALAAGADIIRDLEDAPPGRLFVAADPEGHRWMFLQPSPAPGLASSAG